MHLGVCKDLIDITFLNIVPIGLSKIAFTDIVRMLMEIKLYYRSNGDSSFSYLGASM